MLGDEAPRHRRPVLGEQLVEVVDDDVGAVLDEGIAPGAAIDADGQGEPPGVAGGDAGDGVLDDGGPLRADAQFGGRGEERVGRRLAGQLAGGGDVAVDDDGEAIGEAGGLEHLGGVARRRHHADRLVPRRSRASRKRTDPGYGSMPSRRSTSWNAAFLALPRAFTVSWPGSSSIVPSGRAMPREAMNERTPSTRRFPST